MLRLRFWFVMSLAAVGGVWLSFAHSQPAKTKTPPRPEPVAETKLLMEGMANPNTPQHWGNCSPPGPRTPRGGHSRAARHSCWRKWGISSSCVRRETKPARTPG